MNIVGLNRLLRINIVLIISLIIFNSCDEREGNVQLRNNNNVELQYVRNLTDELNISKTFNNGKSSLSQNFIIESIHPVKDEEGNLVYYIINYLEGGFIVLSGDKRTHPILAYSAESTFPMDSLFLSAGLLGWLEEEKDFIKEIKKSNKKQSKEISKLWDKGYIEEFINSGNDGIAMPPEEDPPSDETDPNCYVTTVYGPLLQTKWNQGCGYNSLLSPCSSGGACGKVYTGCVATAMAQVMKYHGFPKTYNWDLMPNTYGTTEISKLMRDIGNAVKMDYGCDASSTNTSFQAPMAFVVDFGFKSASYEDYSSSETVKNNIRNNLPLIFRGGTKETFLGIIPYDAGGHAWVCDGYRTTYYCDIGATYLYYHMNWGWGSLYDGWFAHGNWNPGVYSFNYKKGIIYNIIP